MQKSQYGATEAPKGAATMLKRLHLVPLVPIGTASSQTLTFPTTFWTRHGPWGGPQSGLVQEWVRVWVQVRALDLNQVWALGLNPVWAPEWVLVWVLELH